MTMFRMVSSPSRGVVSAAAAVVVVAMVFLVGIQSTASFSLATWPPSLGSRARENRQDNKGMTAFSPPGNYYYHHHHHHHYDSSPTRRFLTKPTQSLRPARQSDNVVSDSSRLYASPNDNDNDDEAIISKGASPASLTNVPLLLIFGGIPVCSAILTLLLQFGLIAPLVIAKRLYIYAMATLVVVVASLRSASVDSPALGTRLVDLTREILPQQAAALSSLQQGDEDNQRQQGDNDDDTRFQALSILDDTVNDSTQAIGVPLLVVTSLATSIFLVSFLQNPPAAELTTTDDASLFAGINDLLRAVLPNLIVFSNACVIGLFTRAEIARAPFTTDNNASSPLAITMGALGLTALAFWGPAAYVWPLQNCVSVCLAIAVARAIQLPRLGPILLALSGLVLYDVVSVGLQLVELGSATMAAGASTTSAPAVDAAGASTSQAASSAMGAVALAKAAAGTWQPGLFVVRLRGSVTDLLGLGDAVFPTLLTAFCRRYDLQVANINSDDELTTSPYFAASLLGFVGGCVACEFVPGIGSTGLPALLFIVPSMLLTVGLTGIVQSELNSLWTFDPAANGEERTIQKSSPRE